jgi:hypothetical protein
MRLLGIDVSHYQGDINWRLAKRDVTFAFAKCTEGVTFKDPLYHMNVQGMKANGIVPGSYHFLKVGNEVAQARAFVAQAVPSTMHAVDVEVNGPCDMDAFVNEYRKHYPSKELMVYTGRDLWARTKPVNPGTAYGKLWADGVLPNQYVAGTGDLVALAQKVAANSALPWGGWTVNDMVIMQFTDKARVTGVPVLCDGDIARVSLATLIEYTTDGKVSDMPFTIDDAHTNWSNVIPGSNVKPPITELAEANNRAEVINSKVDALTAKVDALAATVAAIPVGSGGIDSKLQAALNAFAVELTRS